MASVQPAQDAVTSTNTTCIQFSSASTIAIAISRQARTVVDGRCRVVVASAGLVHPAQEANSQEPSSMVATVVASRGISTTCVRMPSPPQTPSCIHFSGASTIAVAISRQAGTVVDGQRRSCKRRIRHTRIRHRRKCHASNSHSTIAICNQSSPHRTVVMVAVVVVACVWVGASQRAVTATNTTCIQFSVPPQSPLQSAVKQEPSSISCMRLGMPSPPHTPPSSMVAVAS